MNCKIELCRIKHIREKAPGIKIMAFNLWHLLRTMHTEGIVLLSVRGSYLIGLVLRKTGQHGTDCSS